MQLGENNNLFDFTYVGNIAYAHLLAAFRLVATYNRLDSGASALLDHEKVDGEAFNITNDSPAYFWDIAHYMWSLADRVVEPSEVWVLPEGLLGPICGILEGVMGLLGKTPSLTRRQLRYSCMTRYYSTEKAKYRLAYLPVIGLDEGLARGVGWLRAERSKGEDKKAQ